MIVSAARAGLARLRGYGPTGTILLLLLFASGAIAAVVGTVVLHSEGARSSYVQHHGLRATGTVNSVVNTEQCGRSSTSCSYTATVAVALDAPVGGTHSTVAHYPDFSTLSQGDPVTVLVDPSQPGYAELPGAAVTPGWIWILVAFVALIFTAVAAVELRALRNLLAGRREHRSNTGLPSGP